MTDSVDLFSLLEQSRGLAAWFQAIGVVAALFVGVMAYREQLAFPHRQAVRDLRDRLAARLSVLRGRRPQEVFADLGELSSVLEKEMGKVNERFLSGRERRQFRAISMVISGLRSDIQRLSGSRPETKERSEVWVAPDAPDVNSPGEEPALGDFAARWADEDAIRRLK